MIRERTAAKSVITECRHIESRRTEVHCNFKNRRKRIRSIKIIFLREEQVEVC